MRMQLSWSVTNPSSSTIQVTAVVENRPLKKRSIVKALGISRILKSFGQQQRVMHAKMN